DEGSASHQSINEVVVTGTRVPGRTALDSPVPVDVLGEEDLRRSGAIPGELGEMLATLLPSAFMARDSNNDLADVVRTVQLRGLDPAHTLVLVNGKRRHNISIVRGAAVDLNNIPVSSIERIEVLRDGAAAQYGSDAIAGVVNILLKDADQGGSMASTYGSHVTHFAPTNEHITDGETFLISANRGLELGRDGYLNLTAEYRDRNATQRAGAPQEIPFFENQTPANLALTGKKNFQAGDSAFTDFNSVFNAGLALSGTTRLYAFGSLSYREAEGRNFFRYPDSSANVQAIYPNGFLPITDTTQLDYSATAGAKGKIANGWSWDAGVSFGGNHFDFDIDDSVNASLGSASPTRFDVAEYSFRNLILNVDVSKPIAVGWLGNPLNVAYGLELRREIYATDPGEEASYIAGPLAADGAAIGVQGNAGLRPEDTVDESRDEIGFYVDMESELTDRLLLGAAVRLEHYSDFGETVDGKLSTRFAVSPQLAVRGSAGTGFRAPSLTQSYFRGGTTDFDSGSLQLVSNSFLPATDPVARLLGSRALEPEESRSYSIGSTFNTGAGLVISIDAYRIDIDDRIVLSEIIGGSEVTNYIADNLGIANISTVRFFTNAVDSKTRGVDLVVDYTFPATSYSSLTLSAAASYAETVVEDVEDNPAVLTSLGAVLISDATVAGIERSRPRTKLILSGHWMLEKLALLARASYLGSTEHNTPFGRQSHSPEWLFDLDLEYALGDRVRVALGGNNIFDNYPDRTVEGNSYFGNFPYDIVAPIGMNGAYYYARVTYGF
ncbi:MAG TPA: TonB-dependent receptor, partial [Terrimicrobiaceae bacterium]|nr:TonB-dependent receptor [Terrimicrobiaceae bacterium]